MGIHAAVGGIRLVVADLAGTTIDFGSSAPAGVFVALFARHGVTVTDAEARGPMGTAKRDHIAALAARLDVPLLGAVPRLRADEVASGDAATPRSEVFAARARAMAAQAARHFDGTALEAALILG